MVYVGYLTSAQKIDRSQCDEIVSNLLRDMAPFDPECGNDDKGIIAAIEAHLHTIKVP